MEDLQLEYDFEQTMLSPCRAAQDLGYYPGWFLGALERKGAVPYAKELVVSGEFQSGLKRLRDLNRLDLSIEHLVAEVPRFRTLFTEEEREAARWRLEQVRREG